METISKNQLIIEVRSFLNALAVQQPKQESLEWYLANNLEDYLKDLEEAQKPNEIKVATKILSRFCIESMDWDTPLFKRCTKITELGLKVSKQPA